MAKSFKFMFEIGANLTSKFMGAFSSAGETLSKLKGNINSVGSEIRESEKVVRGLRGELDILDKKLADGEISLYDYCKAYEKTNAEINKQRKLQKDLSNDLEVQVNKRDKLAKSMAAVENNKNQRVQARGDLFDAAGMAMAMAAPIKAAIDMESAMSDVRKVVDGLDDKKAFNAMQNDILNLSKRIPMAADGLAQIVASGGQAGIAKNELLGFAESAAKMGTAFDITAEEAGDMMAKWRTAFKMNQAEVVELADKINYLGNNTAASAPLISDVVRRIGPLGEIGGVASGEIAALGASMIGAGVESEVAATGLKNLMLGMTAGASATKTQSEAFAQLGLKTTDVAKRMQTDAKGAITDILTRIQSLPKYQQNSILKDLFGSDSIGAIAPLLSNLDNLKNNFQLVGDKSKYAGSMEAEFQAKIDTTSAKLQLTKNAVIGLGVSLGNALLPAVQKGAEGLTKGADAVSAFAEKHPGLTNAAALTATTILGLNVALIALKYAFLSIKAPILAAKLAYTTLRTNISLTGNASLLCAAKTKAVATAQKIATAAQWAWNAALSANPIGLVIVGIAALIAIGIALWRNWDTVSQFLSNMWQNPIVRALAFLTPIGAIIGIGKYLKDHWQGIKNFFTTLWNNPSAAVDMFISGIKSKFAGAFDWLKSTWGKVKAIFSGGAEKAAATRTTVKPGHATGGIFNREHIARFAEGNKAEAVIPLEANRSQGISLWKQAGEMLGMTTGSSGSITATYSPNITIQGNTDAQTIAQLKAVLQDDQAAFERRIKALINQKGRVSFA